MAKDQTSDMDLVAEARRNWESADLGEVNAMVSATSLARAHQIVLGRINQALTPFSLTFSRYEALALLSFARGGAMAMARVWGSGFRSTQPALPARSTVLSGTGW